MDKLQYNVRVRLPKHSSKNQ